MEPGFGNGYLAQTINKLFIFLDGTEICRHASAFFGWMSLCECSGAFYLIDDPVKSHSYFSISSMLLITETLASSGVPLSLSLSLQSVTQELFRILLCFLRYMAFLAIAAFLRVKWLFRNMLVQLHSCCVVVFPPEERVTCLSVFQFHLNSSGVLSHTLPSLGSLPDHAQVTADCVPSSGAVGYCNGLNPSKSCKGLSSFSKDNFPWDWIIGFSCFKWQMFW